MKLFKPEDFQTDDLRYTNIGLLEICGKANAKLEREGKRVYGALYDGPDSNDGMWVQKPARWTQPYMIAYQALLIAIEPIENKCEHSQASLATDEFTYQFTCRACKAKLKPTGWVVVE